MRNDRDVAKATRRGEPSVLSVQVMVLVAGMGLARRVRRDQAGFVVAEALAMAAVGVVIVIALWAAMKVVGVDVIDGIRESIVGGGSSTPTSTPTPP